jgi:hypothetical protein
MFEKVLRIVQNVKNRPNIGLKNPECSLKKSIKTGKVV